MTILVVRIIRSRFSAFRIDSLFKILKNRRDRKIKNVKYDTK